MSDPKIGAPCRCIGEVFVLDGVSTCSKCGARWGVSKAVYGPQTTVATLDKFADRWRFLTREKATAPPSHGFVQIIRNHWWVVCPERGLAFFHSSGVNGLGSPQCNSNEALSRRLGSTIPGATIEMIDLVFVPVSLEDYL